MDYSSDTDSDFDFDVYYWPLSKRNEFMTIDLHMCVG